MNKTNSYSQTMRNAHEAGPLMSIPLFLLAIGSLFIGYLSKDMIIGLGSTFWGNSIFILSASNSFIEAEYLPYHIKAIPLIFSHLGIFFAYHTTQFLSNGRVMGSAVDKLATESFQKHLMFYRFATSPACIKIYVFFNQK